MFSVFSTHRLPLLRCMRLCVHQSDLLPHDLRLRGIHPSLLGHTWRRPAPRLLLHIPLPGHGYSILVFLRARHVLRHRRSPASSVPSLPGVSREADHCVRKFPLRRERPFVLSPSLLPRVARGERHLTYCLRLLLSPMQSVERPRRAEPLERNVWVHLLRFILLLDLHCASFLREREPYDCSPGSRERAK